MVPEKMSSPEGLGVTSAVAIMHELYSRQKILLVGGHESRQRVRASILRAHGLQLGLVPTDALGR
jgi:hypothetical protein